MSNEKEKIDKIANRHVGKLLGKLSEVDCPDIYKDAFKRQFWYFVDDVKQVISESDKNEKIVSTLY